MRCTLRRTNVRQRADPDQKISNKPGEKAPNWVVKPKFAKTVVLLGP